LWGVDTPETKAPGKPVGYFGPEATAFIEKMLASGTVTIELEKESLRGKFGRLLGFVYTSDGKMLNEQLLRTGHAYADGRWRHRFYFRFQEIEKQARKNKLGLWLNAKPQDMPRHVRRRLGTGE
jgi:micrococcal nuclease